MSKNYTSSENHSGVFDWEKVKQLALLDTPVEPEFERITEFVCKMLRVDSSAITLIANNRQFFKSTHGLPEELAERREVDISESICNDAFASDEIVAVSDMQSAQNLRNNPMVGRYGFSGYLGALIHAPDGSPVGSLCAITNEPRIWSREDRETLQFLAEQVDAEIQLGSQAREAMRLADERLLVAREYHHRIRNAFSIASALIIIEGAHAKSTEQLVEDMSVQLAALAASHGAMGFEEGSLDFAVMIERLLAPYNFSGARRSVSGPSVVISEEKLVPLSLILNELATNATKYGAFRHGGQVELNWELADGRLEVRWDERSDGPAPKQPIEGTSFGGTMIELSVAQLNASLSRSWKENGLSVCLSFPLA